MLTKKKIKIYILLSIIPIFFIIFFLIRIYNSNSQRENYIKDFDVSFSGIVKKKKKISNGAGIVYLEVAKTTHPFYDVRKTNKMYLCVIKDGKADLVLSQLFLIEIGDSIVVNSQKKKINLYRNNVLNKEWNLFLPTNTTFFYSFLRKEHNL